MRSENLMAELSGIFYEDPSSKLKLIGVTGTNGKTTINYLIQYFLEQCRIQNGTYRNNRLSDRKHEIRFKSDNT